MRDMFRKTKLFFMKRGWPSWIKIGGVISPTSLRQNLDRKRLCFAGLMFQHFKQPPIAYCPWRNSIMKSEVIIAFPPILPKVAHTLILGSMSGGKSLELDQYYAHPQNQLWRFMCDIFGA